MTETIGDTLDLCYEKLVTLWPTKTRLFTVALSVCGSNRNARLAGAVQFSFNNESFIC